MEEREKTNCGRSPNCDWTHQAPKNNVPPTRGCGLMNLTTMKSMNQRAAALLFGWLSAAMALGAAGGVEAYRGRLEIPTYPWWPAVQHPYFRGTDKVNIYPYPMLDQLSRTRERRVYETVVLENEYLRVTFLPELGGKVHEVVDKTTGQPMFYVNHVIKPGLIGQCGAWASGGIEWNTGPQGHTVSAMQPVDVQILPPAADGSRTVAIGEVERIYRTRWTVQVTLRPGRSYLDERIRIHNPTESVRPYYFWNCTAVPNTPGFRFIYPMTLGCDHGATKFFSWPIDHGKDLSRGTNYQDASSIFAWHCDQDFFGSYDDRADRGVVACANHRQLPGKKAWTWGQGGFGRMHQMDLTDEDGPYNEVQTGPLLTQADVGRLEPGESVAWQEWWYPVHGLGGFHFANRDVAAQASLAGGKLELRLMGTGSWDPVQVRVHRSSEVVAQAACRLTPREPAVIGWALADGGEEPVEVELAAGPLTLARFRVPLDLPARQPPGEMPRPETASELVRAGWQDFLFGRYSEAEAQFRKAIERDAKSVSAQTGLAQLSLERDPAQAVLEAQKALAIDADHGLARFLLAAAEARLGHDRAALDAAWRASLDPAVAIPARALAARMQGRRCDWPAVVQALSDPGPWRSDPECRNLLALAHLQMGDPGRAVRLAGANLEVDPLDAFARSVRWLADGEGGEMTLGELIQGKAQPVLDLAAGFMRLNQPALASRVVGEFYLRPLDGQPRDPIVLYWAANLAHLQGDRAAVSRWLVQARAQPPEGVFPHRFETIPVLQWALKENPKDGRAALYLGHLCFHLGRLGDGRSHWRLAAQLDGASAIAWRALGMASLNVDGDMDAAARELEQARQIAPADPIAARDLARVWFARADKAQTEGEKRKAWAQVRAVLEAAYAAGQSRSDFVVLLARAQNRLGRFDETARMLDAVRVTVWEGAREVHDLFEDAHLALGRAHLEAGRPAEALAEFDRALEYPENLATGRLENAREAHIHYLRGNALQALGHPAEARAAWQRAAGEPAASNPEIEDARQKARQALDGLLP